jgi:endo-1,4-beta-xylanase
MRTSRRAFLENAALLTPGALYGRLMPSEAIAAESRLPTELDLSSLPPLRATAARAGIFYGAAVEPGYLAEADFANAVQKECNLIVPEDSLKWYALQPARGHWDFDDADRLLAFAEKNNMRMRGHTLVWEYTFPAWAQDDLDSGMGAQLLHDHIYNVVSHYKGRLLSWDVVNEAVAPKDGQPYGLAKNRWLKALGPDYIATAFRLAAEADPSALLVYNDYIVEGDDEKRAAILALLRRLKDKGVPIHAIGVQSHLWAPTRQNVEKIKLFCRDVTQMGLDYYVTELDVGESDYQDDPASRDRLVAERTKEYLGAVLTECKPKEILTWGLSDRYSWMRDPRYFKTNRLGLPVRGLPLDASMQRTPMWLVLHEMLSSIA